MIDMRLLDAFESLEILKGNNLMSNDRDQIPLGYLYISSIKQQI